VNKNPANVPARQGRNGTNADTRLASLVRPLLHGLIFTLCLFAAFEVVERLWLSDVDMETLHLLHLLRGIYCSLVVAGFVGWMIITTSPKFLPPTPEDGAWPQRPRLTAGERIKTFARWFIAMRWIAALLAAILVIISVQLMGWLPQEVWWPSVSAVTALAGLNILYTFLLRRERSLPALLLLQGYLDLGLLTFLLHYSGGIENPLSAMMIFHVIIGGILLSRRQCYWIATTASLLFALLAWAEWSDTVEHYTLQLFPHLELSGGELFHPAHHVLYAASRVILQTVVLFLTAYFVTTLAERLRENERRLEAMAGRALAGQQLLEQALETTGTGLRVLGHDLQPFWANNRWNEWLERPPDRTSPVAEGSRGADTPASQTLSDGRIRVTEISVMRPGDALPTAGAINGARVIQVTTAPVPDMTGKIQQVVELAQDITQQKQAQDRMMRAGRLAAVGELAGQVAHEVNNPIAIISAKVRLLLTNHREEMSPKIAQELAKITDLSNRVAHIAQGLLSYCRPSPAVRVRLDVRQPIRKSLTMVEQHAQKIGVAVQDDLPAALAPVKANAGELEQLFLNLFLNAFDAMPRGGQLRVGAVATALANGEAAIGITVEDSGTGIPAAIRERIFEPFFTTKQEGRGTGLGLSICVGLARSHGGEIMVESEPGRGSRFTVKLPVEENAREPRHG
jgi:C4-dicarboxylate-specific signal transduction histidine kinase